MQEGVSESTWILIVSCLWKYVIPFLHKNVKTKPKRAFFVTGQAGFDTVMCMGTVAFIEITAKSGV